MKLPSLSKKKKFNFISAIKALVNSSENLITRIQLREEFARSGFDPVLKRIQNDSNPELATQVAVYFEESEADFADATSAYLVYNGSDLNNPLVICNELIRGIKERAPEANKYFVSVLQQMLVVPEGRGGLQEWRVLDIFLQHMGDMRGQTLTAMGWVKGWESFFEQLEMATGIPAPNFHRGATEIDSERLLMGSMLEKDEIIADLSARIETLELELASLKKDNKVAHLEETSELEERHKSEIDALTAKIAFLDSVVLELRPKGERADELSSQNALLKADLEKIKSEKSALAILHEMVKDDLDSLNIEVAQLKISAGNAQEAKEFAKQQQEQTKKVQKELAAFRETEIYLKAEKDTLETQAKENATKIATLEAQLAKFQEQVNSLTSQLKATEAKAASEATIVVSPPAAPSPLPPPPPPGMPGPPPPPGMSGGPPPPPPGPGGPPPPPGMGGFAVPTPGLPSKKVIKPTVPLKQLNWSKLPNHSISDTVWASVSDDSVQLDNEELETLFQKKVVNTKEEGEQAGKAAAAPAVAKKPTKVTLLEFSRANNLAIMLARLKMTYHEVKVSILTLNGALSPDSIKSLKQFTPTEEEIGILRDYAGDIEELGNAEKYFLEIMNIPVLEPRLNSMSFVQRFESLYQEITPSIECLMNAAQEVKDSAKFRDVLSVILALGNYLNGSSFRGGAYGFKLSAILSLSDIKTSDSSKYATLLHYLEKLLFSKDPNLLNFIADMPNVPEAQRVSASTTLAGIKDLQTGLLDVQKTIDSLKTQTLDESDRFVTVMEQFVTENKPKVDELHAQAEKADKELKALLKLFAEDDGTTSEEFFSTINKFSLNLKKAHVENEQAKEVQKPKPMPKPKPAGLGAPVMGMGMGMGMGIGAGDLDNALNQLKRGKSFKGKREERRNNLLSGEEKVAPEALLRLQNLRKAN